MRPQRINPHCGSGNLFIGVTEPILWNATQSRFDATQDDERPEPTQPYDLLVNCIPADEVTAEGWRDQLSVVAGYKDDQNYFELELSFEADDEWGQRWNEFTLPYNTIGSFPQFIQPPLGVVLPLRPRGRGQSSATFTFDPLADVPLLIDTVLAMNLTLYRKYPQGGRQKLKSQRILPRLPMLENQRSLIAVHLRLSVVRRSELTSTLLGMATFDSSDIGRLPGFEEAPSLSAHTFFITHDVSTANVGQYCGAKGQRRRMIFRSLDGPSLLESAISNKPPANQKEFGDVANDRLLLATGEDDFITSPENASAGQGFQISSFDDAAGEAGWDGASLRFRGKAMLYYGSAASRKVLAPPAPSWPSWSASAQGPVSSVTATFSPEGTVYPGTARWQQYIPAAVSMSAVGAEIGSDAVFVGSWFAHQDTRTVLTQDQFVIEGVSQTVTTDGWCMLRVDPYMQGSMGFGTRGPFHRNAVRFTLQIVVRFVALAGVLPPVEAFRPHRMVNGYAGIMFVTMPMHYLSPAGLYDLGESGLEVPGTINDGSFLQGRPRTQYLGRLDPDINLYRSDWVAVGTSTVGTNGAAAYANPVNWQRVTPPGGLSLFDAMWFGISGA